MSCDVAIVGSGAAAVAAAQALEGLRVVVVDVGREPEPPRLEGALYDARDATADLAGPLLGEHYESLSELFGEALNAKLKGPGLRHVTRDADRLAPIESPGFVAVQSFARGGLANAWGAGAYRFDADELAPFPFDAAELVPCFDRLTSLLGISGAADDLAPFFGDDRGLDPPLALGAHGELFLRRYTAQRQRLNAQGIHVGRARLAVTTVDRPERPGYAYRGVDFFEPEPAVYSPAQTLDALVAAGRVELLSGRLATGFTETPDGVLLALENLASGQRETVSARRLLLAAGAIGSARLALASRGDREAALPILDNPTSFIPLFAPERIGRAQERRFFGGAQLNLVYRGSAHPEPVQGSFYDLSGVLRSDFVLQLPIAARDLAFATRAIAPALAVIQLFYPDTPSPENRLRLGPNRALSIRHAPARRGEVERVLLRAVRRLGYLGLPGLCQYPAPGSSIHYAGTLPMRATPNGPYETHPDGRLGETRGVYVCDAATFPQLPAKNLTFTAMANALRIGQHVARSLGR